MSNYRISNHELADAFKALSNPNRLQIFMQMLGCCEPGTVCSVEDMQSYCVSELGNSLDIAPSTLSHHIKELSRAGLILTRRRGQHVDCCVNTEMVDKLGLFFQASEAQSAKTAI